VVAGAGGRNKRSPIIEVERVDELLHHLGISSMHTFREMISKLVGEYLLAQIEASIVIRRSKIDDIII
jgi:hypothetical protein